MAQSNPESKYDIFLVHCTDDGAPAEQINEALKKQGYKTWAHYKEGNEFDAGKPIFDNIIRAVELSRTVLILVTKNALESEWVTFEMLLAFEKSHREDLLCARLVFVGVSEKEKKGFLTGDLELIPSVTVDFNRDSWTTDLVQLIEKKVSMVELLPAGNVAVGLVYNYFVGYLRIILPELSKSVQVSEHNKEARMFSRFLLLVPDSCRIPKIEGQHGDYVIEKMEKSLHIEASHGDKKRVYNPTVYSITHKESEPYFFVGECPFILETMHKINAKNFAHVDLKFQVRRFGLTLRELVNHRHNKQCQGTVRLIQYDDEAGFPAAEIWKTLDEELKQISTVVEEKKVMNKAGTLKATSDQELKYFAIVTNIDSEADKNTATQIFAYLTKKDVKFSNGEGGQSEIPSYDEASFNVFVLSEESVKDELFNTQSNSALQAAVSDNEVKVFGVVTKGTDIQRLPQNWSWITLLKEDEPDYLDKLWEAMQNKRKMSETIPVGKVYEGLAYAYLLNYLGLAVTGTTADGKDFGQRFKDAVTKYNAGCPCVPRVFVIIPKSCSFPGPGSQFPGEEHLGQIEPVVMGFRKYFLQLYRLTLSDGQNVCYAREYATPAITLHEMANTIPYSGLTKEAMNDQAQKFSEFVTRIIHDDQFKQNVEDLEDKVTVVYFDDEETGAEGMTKALEPELLKCLKDEKLYFV